MDKLIAKCDTHKSFYDKAHVKNDNGCIELYSYNTHVCTITEGNYFLNGDVKKELLLSQTTMRHIKEFLFQNLGITPDKKELKKHIF